MASIANMLPQDVIVRRDGQQVHIEAKNLVPGDLVQLSMGSKVSWSASNLS